MAKNKSTLMKVDREFKSMVYDISKQNKITMTQATRDIAKSLKHQRGKKILRRRIIEEVSF